MWSLPRSRQPVNIQKPTHAEVLKAPVKLNIYDSTIKKRLGKKILSVRFTKQTKLTRLTLFNTHLGHLQVFLEDVLLIATKEKIGRCASHYIKQKLIKEHQTKS